MRNVKQAWIDMAEKTVEIRFENSGVSVKVKGQRGVDLAAALVEAAESIHELERIRPYPPVCEPTA